ncbi:peptidoglycan editing factor PgeF [Pontibacter sp. JAM-7]|uniref:peptidoglycan editing factor PgeF n=1 Tax=Pontibacter sp. JAM-7 TaxID=3366581 RepID=UPI003AF61B69
MQWIQASWPAPKQVHALTTTRLGGVSNAPFASLNLGDHVDDLSESVAKNRVLLLQSLGLVRSPQWLQQVHGTDVVEASDNGLIPEADACWTVETGLACIVMTADCLPVFFTNSSGTRVAVAHAGWRGLLAGILEKTLQQFNNTDDVIAWLGPAIGPKAFEVGDEVRAAFLSQNLENADAFEATGVPEKYMADLYQLARMRLKQAGVVSVSGGDYCTFNDADKFFSYRRDGMTGRMASLIWIEDMRVPLK